MSTWSRIFLSESTNGRPIKVVQTATPGTLIHTAIAGESDKDMLYLWANNTDSSTRKLTIEFGGVSSPDDHIATIEIPALTGMVKIVDGLPLQNGLVVRAFGAAANILTMAGYVNRETA